MRIGYGEDTHRFGPGRKLILGGVEVDFFLGLIGHSDADALVHSIIDALLGAAALGDIGQHFPDSDMQYKDISSILLLEKTNELLREKGYRLINCDSTIIAQKPKLAPYILDMRANIAKALNIDIDSVSVKATTPEKTNAEGRLECITVRSVALIDRI
ncbi:MAG TPA: 2-C-methyl-D-erythritol 2,4-cyclodiphosphate synthase [Clostridiales bacterium]|jgi:2-C-methyl-D-erythritol 2,4-cyclodiphosphate synthase|nr:2-C-methyl-D-erythritol 2,4-cyclodiphosphate synthase [Clostridiales bacterium]